MSKIVLLTGDEFTISCVIDKNSPLNSKNKFSLVIDGKDYYEVDDTLSSTSFTPPNGVFNGNISIKKTLLTPGSQKISICKLVGNVSVPLRTSRVTVYDINTTDNNFTAIGDE
jgi:hypothetical protein